MALTRKIKKAQSSLLSLKEELKDICHENHREQEGLLENIRQLTKELSYLEAIEKFYIPDDYRVSELQVPLHLDILRFSEFFALITIFTFSDGYKLFFDQKIYLKMYLNSSVISFNFPEKNYKIFPKFL